MLLSFESKPNDPSTVVNPCVFTVATSDFRQRAPYESRQHTGTLDVKVIVKDGLPKHHGQFMDTYYGECLTATNRYAIKRIRFDPRDDTMRRNVISMLALAEVKWSSIIHENICPVWSVKSPTEHMLTIAMPWFDNGNVLDFTRENPAVDKVTLVKQVANAVAYLHAMDEVHGNIVPTNILITEDGRACLSDIGLNAHIFKHNCRNSWRIPSCWAFKAPEELSPQCDPALFSITKSMDVYAFASTVYMIFTCNPPFRVESYARELLEIITCGNALSKPIEITDPLWALVRSCWSYNPDNRPSMGTVASALTVVETTRHVQRDHRHGS